MAQRYAWGPTSYGDDSHAAGPENGCCRPELPRSPGRKPLCGRLLGIPHRGDVQSDADDCRTCVAIGGSRQGTSRMNNQCRCLNRGLVNAFGRAVHVRIPGPFLRTRRRWRSDLARAVTASNRFGRARPGECRGTLICAGLCLWNCERRCRIDRRTLRRLGLRRCRLIASSTSRSTRGRRQRSPPAVQARSALVALSPASPGGRPRCLPLASPAMSKPVRRFTIRLSLSNDS
jgi:hypothetical protein